MRWLLFSWMCLLALAGGHEARGAEIYRIQEVNGPPGGEILVKGDIAEGDYATFYDLLVASEPYVDRVLLISNGGNVREAMRIGELIRQRLLTTTAPMDSYQRYHLYSVARESDICTGQQCICASACFLIWAAGVERSGWVIMVHRPRDASGAFKSKPAARASEEYREAISRIDGYLRRMEVPLNVIELMQSTPSNDISPLPFEVARSMQIPPSIKEWLIPNCGAMTLREETDQDKLYIAKMLQPGYLELSIQRILNVSRQQRRANQVLQFPQTDHGTLPIGARSAARSVGRAAAEALNSPDRRRP